jgi:hypothetical protein
MTSLLHYTLEEVRWTISILATPVSVLTFLRAASDAGLRIGTTAALGACGLSQPSTT